MSIVCVVVSTGMMLTSSTRRTCEGLKVSDAVSANRAASITLTDRGEARQD